MTEPSMKEGAEAGQSGAVRLSALGRRAERPTIARLMNLALERRDVLSLAAGFTDSATLPMKEVREAVDLLASGLVGAEWLQYGMNQGRPELRQLLARRLAKGEPEIGAIGEMASRILVTNGSQQALYLAVQVLCDPGDIVLVDRPSYFVFLEMLSGLGVEARSIPTDGAGRIDQAALEGVLDRMALRGEMSRLKAVYFVSYFSNPSSRSLAEKEKNELAAALRGRGCLPAVIEDAAYRELYFESPHGARSVLTLPAWEDFPRLYLSTMTKSFATGMKLGFGYCTDALWLEKMLAVKGHHDFGTSNMAQAVAERVISNGTFDRHLSKMRTVYRRKMEALDEALETQGLRGLGWKWVRPKGGLYLWLRGPGGLATGLDSAFCRACLDHGVIYVPGELCFGDDAPVNDVRLSFGVLGEAELAEAARRFVSAARSMGAPRAGGGQATIG